MRCKAETFFQVTAACLWSGAEVITQNVYWLMAAELPSAQLRRTCLAQERKKDLISPQSRLAPLVCSGVQPWECLQCGPHLSHVSAFADPTSFAVPPMLFKMNLRAGFVWAGLLVPVIAFMVAYLPETRG